MLFLFKFNNISFRLFSKNKFSSILYGLYFILLFCPTVISAQQTITKKSIDKQFEEALSYVSSGNPEKAIPILNKIKQNSKTINYKSGITKVGYTLAIIYFNSSDYNKVINLQDEYLDIGNQINDYENISHIHRLKGCAYSELGLLSKGSVEYKQALQYAAKIASNDKRQYALSLIYSNLANHHMKSSAPQDSILNNIKKGIAAAEKISDKDSLNISKKYSLIAYSYIIMANEYDKTGNRNLAENYYLRSLEIHNSKSVPIVEKVVLLNQLAYFYYDQKDFSKTIKYAELGISIEKKARLPQLRRDLFEILSKSYMELQ